jgi:hypothetical protein
MRQILIFGGVLKGGKVTNELLMFDTGLMGWTAMPMSNAPSPRYGHAAVIFDDRLVIIGGRDEKNIFGDISYFDLTKLQWRKSAATGLPARYSHCAFATSKRIVVLGGAATEPIGPPPMAINPVDWSSKEYATAGHAPLGLIKFAFDVSEDGVLVFGGCEAGHRIGWNAMFMVTLPEEIEVLTVRGRTSSGERKGRGRKTMRVQGGERPFVPMADEGGDQESCRAATQVGSGRPKLDGPGPDASDVIEVRGRRATLSGARVIKLRQMRGQHLGELGEDTMEQLRSSIAISGDEVPKDGA